MKGVIIVFAFFVSVTYDITGNGTLKDIKGVIHRRDYKSISFSECLRIIIYSEFILMGIISTLTGLPTKNIPVLESIHEFTILYYYYFLLFDLIGLLILIAFFKISTNTYYEIYGRLLFLSVLKALSFLAVFGFIPVLLIGLTATSEDLDDFVGFVCLDFAYLFACLLHSVYKSRQRNEYKDAVIKLFDSFIIGISATITIVYSTVRPDVVLLGYILPIIGFILATQSVTIILSMYKEGSLHASTFIRRLVSETRILYFSTIDYIKYFFRLTFFSILLVIIIYAFVYGANLLISRL